jgi:signal transduction histidine kinase
VEIVVSDDGTGTSVDLSTALDRPFLRPSATSGSGVGLYVCGRLLHQMHGRIRVMGGSPGFSVSIELPEAV